MKNIFFVLFLIFGFNSLSQNKITYKTINNVSLNMEIYFPVNIDTAKKYPTIVFYFGGGWNDGNISQFKPQAEYLSSKSIICILADYRVFSRHGTSPFEALSDAKSLIRFVRQSANELHIDTSRIAAAGGSAGGHLAAATALIDGYNDKVDDLNISCIPNALILFNPVIDNGPEGYGFDRIGKDYHHFSPIHNVKKGVPRTIIFLGTEDKFVPVDTAQRFKQLIEKSGGQCELMLYKGQEHGFFNLRNGTKYYNETLKDLCKFLRSIGYLG